MHLSVSDLTGPLEVSSVTYYKWLNGRGYRPNNRKRVRYILRTLAHMLKTEAWKPDEAKTWVRTRRKAVFADCIRQQLQVDQEG